MGTYFLEKLFTPFVYVQDNQRVTGEHGCQDSTPAVPLSSSSPPFSESNALVRATVSVVSAAFGRAPQGEGAGGVACGPSQLPLPR